MHKTLNLETHNGLEGVKMADGETWMMIWHPISIFPSSWHENTQIELKINYGGLGFQGGVLGGDGGWWRLIINPRFKIMGHKYNGNSKVHGLRV